MQSCDTMGVKAAHSAYHQNLFAKNSDRPTAEAQPLRFFPARENAPDAAVKMTDLEIPDVARTYAMIGSQPYWIWGFEMGINECGVMIGNEAEGSRCPAETETGILGMDLLRLGLERAATAREAIEIITALLEQYGQNANTSALMDRRYENSYLLVDPQEIWILETAGRQWAAKQITDRIGISNCYTIGESYDLASRELEAFARQNHWLAPDQPLHFAKAYTKITNRQTLAIPRMRRLNQQLNAQDLHSFDSLKSILRDHFDGEITQERFGIACGNFFTICMHMREWSEPETVASLISRYDPVLGPVSRFAPAQTCESVYLPIYFTGYLPPALSIGGVAFSSSSLWWKMKRLSLAAAVDKRFHLPLTAKAQALEAELEQLAADAEQQASALIKADQKESAFTLLNQLMDRAVAMLDALCDAEYARIRQEIEKAGGIYGPQRENILQYLAYAKIPF